MTFEIGLVLVILMVAVVLFALEKIRPDVVAMLVLIALALTQLVTPQEAFSGFANPAVVTVGAIFVISDALFRTGVADFLGARILKVAENNLPRLIGVIMLTVGMMSAFMNNIGATAVLMPAVISIARQTKIPPSKLLMPLAFASLMGGNLTLIGTPPNILASAILYEQTGISFRFFDFAPMGILVLGFGVLYMALVGHRLLPQYPHDELTESYQVRQYLSEIHVLPDSPLVGRTIRESRFGEAYDLTIVSIIRDEQSKVPLSRSEPMYPNDVLLVQGSLEKILKVRRAQGLRIAPQITHDHDIDLKSERATLAEVLLDMSSNLAGHTLRELHFRDKYRLNVLALWRRGHAIDGPLSEEPLQHGDVLLVQGLRENIGLLRSSPNFLLLEAVPLEMRRFEKVPVVLGIMAGLLGVVVSGLLHISVAAVIAALAMILFGVLTVDEAYQAIQWRSIFLIGGMLPLGVAMESTHAARFLADLIVNNLAVFGPIAIMVGLYLLTALVTQPMNNAAATVLISPIAINIARGLGADPRAFLMAVVIAASTSFLTPIGHPVNILVLGPAGYKFADYTKVGVGLTLLYVILTAVALPYIWPLFPP